MKELISAIFLVASLFAGSHYLKEIHGVVRKAALEKAAQGLPSLTKMTHALQGTKADK